MTFDSRQLCDTLGAFATGVTIVTTRDGSGMDAGLTVNSFSSVSLNPPMVLWNLAKSAHSRLAFLEAEYFGVHILAADQAALSTLFATRGVDKFAGLPLARGHDNIPLLDGCAARLECKTVFRYEGGDHDILVGEVVSFENFGRPSLVFLSGRYAVALDKPEAEDECDTSEFQEHGMVTSLQYLLGRVHYQCQLALRPELARQSLSEEQLYILACVAFNTPCSVQDVIRLVGISGCKITPADLEKLSKRDLIRIDENAGITEAGRQLLVRIAAANKDIENEALQDFTSMECQILKQMLRRAAQRTLPAWRKPL